MSDLVERLRQSVTKGYEPTDELAIEAADEIERLRGMLQAFIDDPAMNVGRDVRQRVQRALNGTAEG